MILTDEQKAIIKDLVLKQVKYNETFQEVYDHILSTFDHTIEVPDVELEAWRIISSDLGGAKGILTMEQNLVTTVKQSTRQKFAGLFKWPGILIITLLSVIAYCDIKLFAPTIIQFIVFMIFLWLPWFLLAYNNLLTGLKHEELKKTIFNVVMKKMAAMSLWIYMIAKAVLLLLKIKMGINADQVYMEHAFLVLLIMYDIAFYKICTQQRLLLNLKPAVK